MIDTLALGIGLGLVAGLIPGAFSAVVATTTLERGLRDGLRVALVPLATEIPILLVAALVINQLSEDILRWVGVGGGILFFYMAWRIIRDASEGDPMDTGGLDPIRGHLLRVFMVGVLSPTPWVFWFIVGGPLAVNRWHVGPEHAVVFVLAFIVCFIGAMLLLAWGVSAGRKQLNVRWYRRVLRGAGWLLVIVGVVLIWQSWEGNFAEMVQSSESIEERVR